MNRDTATAVWYRQIDPSCFADAHDAASHTAASTASDTPVPATFVRAFEQKSGQRDERGLTRLRAIFGRL